MSLVLLPTGRRRSVSEKASQLNKCLDRPTLVENGREMLRLVITQPFSLKASIFFLLDALNICKMNLE